MILALILVSWVFGWSGGKELIASSYADAKVRSQEMRERHKRGGAPGQAASSESIGTDAAWEGE